MLYLIKGRVEKTEYMNDAERFEDLRIVQADNEDEAEQKYTDFWRAKTCEYSVYYWAEVSFVNPAIL